MTQEVKILYFTCLKHETWNQSMLSPPTCCKNKIARWLCTFCWPPEGSEIHALHYKRSFSYATSSPQNLAVSKLWKRFLTFILADRVLSNSMSASK